jgi:hypothetical protein
LARTLIVILGASLFPKSPKLAAGSAFSNSAADLLNYATAADGLAVENDDVLSLFDDERSPSDQLEQVTTFLQNRSSMWSEGAEGPRNLLLYYVGHGLFTRAERAYCLAVRSTRETHEGASSIRATDLAAAIKEGARNFRRFLVFDCCFSASIYQTFQSAPLEAACQQVAESFPPRGTSLLCSSSSRDVCLIAQDLGRTMFSHALVSSLKEGDPRLDRLISFSELGDLVRHRLQTLFANDYVRPEVHSPDQREGNIASIPLFPNRGFALGVPGSHSLEEDPQAERPVGEGKGAKTERQTRDIEEQVRRTGVATEVERDAQSTEIIDATKLIGSAISRERRQGVNALARMDSPESTEALAQTLKRVYRDVRLFGALELAKRKDARGKGELAQALLHPQPGASYDPITKAEIFAALEGFGRDAIPEIGLLVTAPLTEVRAMAALGIGKLGGPQAAQFLRTALKDESTLVKGHAIDAVAKIKTIDPAIVRDLIALLSDSTEITHNAQRKLLLPYISDSACLALLELNDPDGVRAADHYKKRNATRFNELKQKIKSSRGSFSKLDSILTGAKHRLNSDETFQRIISIVQKELGGDLDENEAAQMSGEEMRNLARFLEETWTELHKSLSRKDLKLRSVYQELGYFVLLCDKSELLWRDEKTPKSKRYWSRFRQFAAAMRRQSKRAQAIQNPTPSTP